MNYAFLPDLLSLCNPYSTEVFIHSAPIPLYLSPHWIPHWYINYCLLPIQNNYSFGGLLYALSSASYPPPHGLSHHHGVPHGCILCCINHHEHIGISHHPIRVRYGRLHQLDQMVWGERDASKFGVGSPMLKFICTFLVSPQNRDDPPSIFFLSSLPGSKFGMWWTLYEQWQLY